MTKLTNRDVEALRRIPGKRREVSDDDTPGLSVRVSPSGVKSWMLRYTAKDGRRRKLSLGRFPAVGLSEARARARKESVTVNDGGDPAADKRKAKRLARHDRITKPQTLSALWEPYRAAKAKKQAEGTRKYHSWLWIKHIKPRLGDFALKELDRPTIKLALREIAKSGDTNANNAQTLLTGMINWAVGEGFMRANPIASLDREHKGKSRERVLTDDEIRTFWAALDTPLKDRERYVSRRMRTALKLALLIPARGGEIVGLSSSEVDPIARTWTIPSARSKTNREHVVPLSPLAVSVLAEAFRSDETLESPAIEDWEGFAFPSPTKPNRHVTRGSFTQAMKWIVNANKIARATPHDLRRTAATYIASERVGVAPHVVTAVLGQQQEGAKVTQVYNRHRYDKEKRAALEAWADLLNEIVTKKPRASNVRALHGGS